MRKPNNFKTKSGLFYTESYLAKDDRGEFPALWLDGSIYETKEIEQLIEYLTKLKEWMRYKSSC